LSGNVVIYDGKNYALIDNKLIESYLIMDRNYLSGFLKDTTTRLENYLNKHGHKSVNILGLNKSLRYKEGIFRRR